MSLFHTYQERPWYRWPTLVVPLPVWTFTVFPAPIRYDGNVYQCPDAKGNHGGRPKVIDDDSLLFARALKDRGVSVPEIAKKLTIKTGNNAGKHPSVASLYRALAEVEETSAPADRQAIGPRRPVRARIAGPGSSTDPVLMERLARQVLDGDNVLDDLARQAQDGPDEVVVHLLAQARDGGTE
ncbi:hypothetical protein ACFW08_38115 [Streptomyces sp. NPDC058960]|uniref:hypothetical protein n=1 Tax=Streptomyces sp. NPDC058960 TaxID=3346679 RepID=UPI0036CC3AF6